MANRGPSVAQIGALFVFALCVIALLVIDTAIVSSGQIGFLTVMLYYGAFVICAPVYWLAAVRSGMKKSRRFALTLTVIFAVAPLTLTTYGYGGPA